MDRAVQAILTVRKASKRPVVVGLNGPQGILTAIPFTIISLQGCGKTPLTQHIVQQLSLHNITADYLSLDDYYLPHSSLRQLQLQSQCQLYQRRGLPGTHDIELLRNHLKEHLGSGTIIGAPVYDKLALNGRGDRSTPVRNVQPVDVLIIEGWMIGFIPLCEESSKLTSDYRLINKALKAYLPVWNLIDIWILLRIADLSLIYSWRWEQELFNCRQRLIECRSYSELCAFVDNFIPAYELYYPQLPTSLHQAYPNNEILPLNLDSHRNIT